MVKFLKRSHSLDKLLRGGGGSSSCRTLRMSAGQHTHSFNGSLAMWEDRGSFGGRSMGRSPDAQQPGWAANRVPSSKSRFSKDGNNGGRKEARRPSDIELIKEKFAKLLLGEDLSGGGKGASSALALSNAITNLAASFFGEHRRLEPMPLETKTRWKKEIDWLLSVTDHIVEFVPSQQTAKDGTRMEIMTTQQRSDLRMNIPALCKLDNMLLDYLDSFKDQNEFWYVTRDSDESKKGNTQRKDDRWWLPTVKVPENGLSEVSRNWLQFQKESVNQVLKAAMAINAQVLSEMETPENYIDSLPKNGRATLGDAIYRSITVDSFNLDQFLASLDLSSEHKILDLKNRIEASVIIWKRKMINKDGKTSWGSAVSLEKREQFEERAETILVLLKQRFPGLPQSALDISKIQYNKDVGQSVLESYSRILESLAYNVMSRIEDVLEVDAITQNPSLVESQRLHSITDGKSVSGPVKFLNPEEVIETLKKMDKLSLMTLSSYRDWQRDDNDAEIKKTDLENLGDLRFSEDLKINRTYDIDSPKKISHMVRLETLNGPTSPAAHR